MTYYLFRSFVSHLYKTPSLFLLSVLGVALGVGSVLAVQIINQNAIGAFAGGVRAVSGEADLTILGQGSGFREELYPEVLATRGVRAAWPIYQVEVALPGTGSSFLQILGVDLLAPVKLPWSNSALDLSEALFEEGWMAVSPALAREKGWEVGEAVRITSGARRVDLRVGALVDFQKVNPLASSKLAVMDIGQVQNLLGAPGELHQIDLQIREGAALEETAERLRSRLGPSVRVVTPEQREKQAGNLMSAFRLNLTALSLISLFVGLFLIHTSTQASLVRRRVEFGLLRSLGATRGQVLGLILAEVALLALVGVGLGLLLGYWVARANMDMVSATLTNLYLLEEIETLRLSPALYLLAAAIGLGGAVAGALLPALDMSRRDSKSLLAPLSLQRSASRAAGPLFLLGVGLLSGSALWFWWLGSAWKPSGFVLALSILATLPLVTPWVVQVACRLMPASGFGLAYSIKTLALRLQSVSFAVSSLAIAVSMLVGITLMVGSFRRTVEVWVETAVQADVYVSTRTRQAGLDEALDEGVIAALSSLPGVRVVDRLRRVEVSRDENRLPAVGVDMHLEGGQTRFPLVSGERDSVLRQVLDEGAVLISEPLAQKSGLKRGDELELFGPGGRVTFRVAGIFYDYSSEFGWVAMDLSVMEETFGKGPIESVSLYLDEGRDAEEVAEAVTAQFPDRPLRVRSNRRLREEVLRIFDQTFAVVRILQGLSLLIAVSGIMLTLLVLAREGSSEIALYRALGSSRRQIFRLYMGKGIGMGFLGIGLGTGGGLLLALILIFIINRVYFGWTIQWYWPGRDVGAQFALILLGAGLASLYPALRASETPATELSREDR